MEIKLSKDFYYRINGEKSIMDLCTKFNTSRENITRNNCDLSLYNGEIVKIKQNEFLTYIVKPADTLLSVSQKCGIDKQTIKDMNNLSTEKLYIGQRLKLPQSD